MKNLFTRLLLAGAVLLPLSSLANNLRVTALGFAPTPSAPGQLNLMADVAWDNSWRDSENWDAVWLFAKYRDPRQPALGWQHATLSVVDADHGVTTGLALNAAADGKGVFVYRSGAGAGSLSGSTTLRWNAAADGITFLPSTLLEVRIFGIEMVHIPEGAFNLNSAELTAQANEFVGIQGSLTSITSEAPLAAGAIRWINDTGAGGTGNAVTVGSETYPGSAALGANYPKGFAALYYMKYEATQGQYTDFLNLLTRPQQSRRVAVDISTDTPAGGKTYVTADAATAIAAIRNTIQCPAAGMGSLMPVTFTCSRPDRPHNFAIWADCAAYLDWAGLRPPSELEFEKACRGPLPVVPGELAGGDTLVAAADTIAGPENGTEVLAPGTGLRPNYAYGFVTYVGGDGGNGPVRAGIFATATTTRLQAGASYYGVMELSGNVWERCVTVAELEDTGQPTNAAAFDRNQNGDGALDAFGDHNVPTWPNSTDVRGSNFRGGNWSRPFEWAAVSDRIYGGSAIAGRTSHRGIRGVRSASTLTNPTYGSGGATFNNAKYHGGSFDGYGPTGTVTVSPVGLRDELAGSGATARPNPASGTVRLTLAEQTGGLVNGTLILTDVLGRPVRQLGSLHGETVELRREGLAPGVYFFRLADARGPVAGGRLVWE